MISIFIEGKEETFLKALLLHIGKQDIIDNITFENVGGWTKLEQLDNKLLDNQESGIKNIVIFDADSVENDGGFDKRYNELIGLLEKIGVSCKIFLFPNHHDNGDYELLLENIINDEHLGLLSCFEGYEKCISQYKTIEGSNKYISPNRKSKLYAYITAFPRSKKQMEKLKKGDWSFINKEYWNLDDAYLDALKNFLLDIET